MALHIETIGGAYDPASPTPTLLAHGFTQNTRCWGAFGSQLAEVSGPVLAVDLPGHGGSHHDDADLPAAATLVIQAIVEGGGASTWIGYSMGGRVLLHAALAAPSHIDRLVLIGSTPGLVAAAERKARRTADERLAERLTTEGVEPFLDFWLDLPLFAGLGADSLARSQRSKNRPEGLAASLRNCGTGTQEQLWDRLAELTMPVLLIAGEQDEKFHAIGHDMAEAIGSNAAFRTIDGAGHACHLEDPTQTIAAIRQHEFGPPNPIAEH